LLIKYHVKPKRQPLIGVLLLLVLAGAPACARAEPWNSLTREQQEALAPLAQQWNTLPIQQQHRLLHTVKHYPSLTPVQKQRFQKRLTTWSRLTPKQRAAARKKYRALGKVPPTQRGQVKPMAQDSQGLDENQMEADDEFSSEPVIPPIAETP